jgi:hypothetical protein
MVTYHYVKFYVSIIINLEVINITVAIFKMATTIPHKFNIVRFQRHFICGYYFLNLLSVAGLEDFIIVRL